MTNPDPELTRDGPHICGHCGQPVRRRLFPRPHGGWAHTDPRSAAATTCDAERTETARRDREQRHGTRYLSAPTPPITAAPAGPAASTRR